MDERIFKIRKQLQSKLSPARYEHTISVSYTCIALAMKYGCDLEQAELAGLLHDCAKRYSDAEIIKKCEKKGLELTESERLAPAVIHAKLGAYLAEHKYGINDPEVLNAIACHTTGKPAMSLLDKILYVADYIEPRRDKAPGLSQIRQLAFEDLDEALYQMMEGTLQYLSKLGIYIDEMSCDAFEYYKNLRDTAGESHPTVDVIDVINEENHKEEQPQYASKRVSKTRRKGHRGKKGRGYQGY